MKTKKALLILFIMMSVVSTIKCTDVEDIPGLANIPEPISRIEIPCIDDPEFTQIFTVDAFQGIDMAGKYCLTDDIDLTSTTFTPFGYPSTTIIGTNFNGRQFTGILDGNNKKITGLSIQQGNDDNIGLFSYIGIDGEVKNLTIENPSIRGKNNVGVLTDKITVQ